MNKVLHEGLELAQQLAALPFKAARQALQETTLKDRAMVSVIQESLALGEGVAKLPFKAAAALITEITETKPNLEIRVAQLEQRVNQSDAGM